MQTFYNYKKYVVDVIGPKDMIATVLCIAFNFGPAGAEGAVKFHEVVSEFPDVEIPKEQRGALSFKQELRVLGFGSAILECPRENETAFISQKMTEAYGPVMDIRFREI